MLLGFLDSRLVAVSAVWAVFAVSSQSLYHILYFAQPKACVVSNNVISEFPMRSLESTTVAVLRSTLDESAQDFADLIGCKLPTLRSVESGRLKLSKKLAARIVEQTGIHEAWLLGEQPKTPMIDTARKPYSVEAFEFIQEKKKLSPAEIIERSAPTEDYVKTFVGDHIRLHVATLASAAIKSVQDGAFMVWMAKTQCPPLTAPAIQLPRTVKALIDEFSTQIAIQTGRLVAQEIKRLRAEESKPSSSKKKRK